MIKQRSKQMKQYEFIAPCHFGLEAVLKRELTDLGYEIVQVEDGKVTFKGEIEAICRANIFLRTTERVLLKVAKFKAETFDELFEKTKAIPWEQWIPEDGKFWVTKATSVKSKLFSPSDIQSIMKKEIIDLGYDITSVEDGRITFFGDEEAVSRANIFLRTAERILIKIGSFRAETFEELFQGTKNLPWEEYIPEDGMFWVA